MDYENDNKRLVIELMDFLLNQANQYRRESVVIVDNKELVKRQISSLLTAIGILIETIDAN
jgi:hypothetical protein